MANIFIFILKFDKNLDGSDGKGTFLKAWPLEFDP